MRKNAKKKKPAVAICYDFDGTLSPRNMQEYGYIPQLKIKPADFWREAQKMARQEEADDVSAYMFLMLEKANRQNNVRFTKDAFAEYGRKLQLFKGVSGWFSRINKYAARAGVDCQHFIISSGIKEIIEGSPIAHEFKKIYASSFIYDQHGVAVWPAFVINFTTKTQFLFRINKGLLESWDNSKINAYIPQDRRPQPFERIIFIGDGATDIPCMRVVKREGGYSIAVYKAGEKNKAHSLLSEDRVNFVAPANYQNGSKLDIQVKKAIDMMAAKARVE